MEDIPESKDQEAASSSMQVDENPSSKTAATPKTSEASNSQSSVALASLLLQSTQENESLHAKFDDVTKRLEQAERLLKTFNIVLKASGEYAYDEAVSPSDSVGSSGKEAENASRSFQERNTKRILEYEERLKAAEAARDESTARAVAIVSAWDKVREHLGSIQSSTTEALVSFSHFVSRSAGELSLSGVPSFTPFPMPGTIMSTSPKPMQLSPQQLPAYPPGPNHPVFVQTVHPNHHVMGPPVGQPPRRSTGGSSHRPTHHQSLPLPGSSSNPFAGSIPVMPGPGPLVTRRPRTDSSSDSYPRPGQPGYGERPSKKPKQGSLGMTLVDPSSYPPPGPQVLHAYPGPAGGPPIFGPREGAMPLAHHPPGSHLAHPERGERRERRRSESEESIDDMILAASTGSPAHAVGAQGNPYPPNYPPPGPGEGGGTKRPRTFSTDYAVGEGASGDGGEKPKRKRQFTGDQIDMSTAGHTSGNMLVSLPSAGQHVTTSPQPASATAATVVNPPGSAPPQSAGVPTATQQRVETTNGEVIFAYPPTNPEGQRICRQCGMPGRYKEGKCVEKWGPGPLGPGTVCDRCRKKMKREERRGTLESQAQQQHTTPHHANSLPTHLPSHPPSRGDSYHQHQASRNNSLTAPGPSVSPPLDRRDSQREREKALGRAETLPSFPRRQDTLGTGPPERRHVSNPGSHPGHPSRRDSPPPNITVHASPALGSTKALPHRHDGMDVDRVQDTDADGEVDAEADADADGEIENEIAGAIGMPSSSSPLQHHQPRAHGEDIHRPLSQASSYSRRESRAGSVTAGSVGKKSSHSRSPVAVAAGAKSEETADADAELLEAIDAAEERGSNGSANGHQVTKVSNLISGSTPSDMLAAARAGGWHEAPRTPP